MDKLLRQIVLIAAALLLAISLRADELPTPIEPVPAVESPLLRWGTPEGTVHHETNWCLAFDGRTRLPRWTLEYLADEPAEQGDRDNRFFADVRVPIEFRPTLADYLGAPFDRGHMVPVANHADAHARAATFTLLNVCPQNPSLNRGLWRSLEKHVRGLAGVSTEVWVATLPIWTPIQGRVCYDVIGKTDVAVPTHFAKSVLMVPAAGEITMTTWLAPNAAPAEGGNLDAWRVTTDAVERLAGLDLWAGLPDDIEQKLESQK